MVKVAATSIIRGSRRGDSHGGIYIVDFDESRVYQPVDWNTPNIDWRGHGGDRGLRGIACYKDRVFVVASDELIEYSPNFERIASYRNTYLKDCHEIDVHERHLFITSAAFDSILAFNLEKQVFEKALMVRTDGQSFNMGQFDPNSEDGPLPMNKLQLNNVHCDKGGIYVSGLGTGGLLLWNGKRLGLSATLPGGARNVRPFRNGIILNDTESNTLRYATPGGEDDCAFEMPLVPTRDLANEDAEDAGIARRGFARGLCAINDSLLVAGSSPSTVSLYDLDQQKRLQSINLSADTRSAIHSITVWPYY